jgi:hypothetical protein
VTGEPAVLNDDDASGVVFAEDAMTGVPAALLSGGTATPAIYFLSGLAKDTTQGGFHA